VTEYKFGNESVLSVFTISIISSIGFLLSVISVIIALILGFNYFNLILTFVLTLFLTTYSISSLRISYHIPAVPIYLFFCKTTPCQFNEDKIAIANIGDHYLSHQNTVTKKIEYDKIENINLKEGLLYDTIIIETDRKSEKIKTRKGYYEREMKPKLLPLYI
jgi:hypothetical protein